jgi:hypothetical protein
MVRSLGLCAVTLFTGWLMCSNTAQADRDRRHEEGTRLTLALDFDYAGALSNDYIEGGGGGALRIGSELDLFIVTMIPELSLGYHHFGGQRDGDSNYDATTFEGMLGGRIRFLKILEPGIFAHAGVGRLGGYDPHTGLAFDAGVTLDFTLLPLIDLGIHAAWNRVFGDSDHDGLSYGTAGFHIALVL